MASPASSSFITSPHDDADEREARALAAKSNIPWDEWVKLYAKCHHCGGKGHIRPNCPDYLKKIENGEVKRPFRPHRNQPHPNYRGVVPQGRQQKFSKDPKMKAFLLVFNALFDGNDDLHKADGDKDDSNHNDKDDDDEMDDDVYNVLAKVGSLKE